jgi:hypothetical protein
MRVPACARLMMIASLAACSTPITGKDRCYGPQDCVRDRVCVDNQCMPPRDGGPDLPAVDGLVPPADGPAETVADVPPGRSDTADGPPAPPPDAPNAEGPRDMATPDLPLDTPVDMPASPADMRVVVDTPSDVLVCAAGCPDGGCPAGSSCCPACAQGCQGGNCRVDIVGDGWRDYDSVTGDWLGHTLRIDRIVDTYLATYTSGPRMGLQHDIVYTNWNTILLGDVVPGELLSRSQIRFGSGDWRR